MLIHYETSWKLCQCDSLVTRPVVHSTSSPCFPMTLYFDSPVGKQNGPKINFIEMNLQNLQ